MKYLACTDFDSSTQTCLASVWVDSAGFWDLSTEETLTLLAAIAGLWGLAYVLKSLIRNVRFF